MIYFLVNNIIKYSSLALSVWPFFSTLIAELVGASACNVVTSLVFLNPKLALYTLPTIIGSQ